MTDVKNTGDEPINDATVSVDELMADASAAAEQVADSAKSFRGRSLEELIPRIRAELGADAIVVRSREGLTGGFAGFFQKRFVEVEARAPLGHEQSDGDLARNDRATSEGLSAPGVKALIDQAHPFAARLAAVQADAAGGESRRFDAEAVFGGGPASPAPASAGLYGPQPNLAALHASAPAVALPRPDEPTGALADRLPGDPLPATGRVVARRPADDADRVTARLRAAGLPSDMAADLVGEAVDHFRPFALAQPLESHVRTVIARRLAVLADLGPGSRTLALVGAGGSGKTSAVANLAVAYAAAGARVLAVVLGEESDSRDLRLRLDPLGIPVHVAGTGEAAAELVARSRPDLAVVDVCDSAEASGLEAVRCDLGALDADEVHLALPATLSAPAAREEHARQRVLGVSHLCLTHADATEHPGAPLALALDRDLPVSFVCTRAAVEPADAAALAARLLA